jgi:hypothetical protein
MVRSRCGSLSILGHSLRNKIPIVGNQGEREGGRQAVRTGLSGYGIEKSKDTLTKAKV